MMQNSDEQKNGRDFEDQIAARQQYTLYENSTYMVVSKIAYLIGVPQTIFENEHEPPQMEWYLELEKDKNARIIRNLCILRTAIERNFRSISQAMRYDLKSILSLPEYIPTSSVDQLSANKQKVDMRARKPLKTLTF